MARLRRVGWPTCLSGRARTRRRFGAPRMSSSAPNGNTYREYELALPRELSPEARVALVERFASQELGSTRP